MSKIDLVKDLKKLIVGPEMVLVKINRENHSGLIVPDSVKKAEPTTGTVYLCGSGVTDIKEGYIVLDIVNERVVSFEYRGDDYILVPRHYVRIVIGPDNYEAE